MLSIKGSFKFGSMPSKQEFTSLVTLSVKSGVRPVRILDCSSLWISITVNQKIGLAPLLFKLWRFLSTCQKAPFHLWFTTRNRKFSVWSYSLKIFLVRASFLITSLRKSVPQVYLLALVKVYIWWCTLWKFLDFDLIFEIATFTCAIIKGISRAEWLAQPWTQGTQTLLKSIVRNFGKYTHPRRFFLIEKMIGVGRSAHHS